MTWYISDKFELQYTVIVFLLESYLTHSDSTLDSTVAFIQFDKSNQSDMLTMKDNDNVIVRM